MINVFNSIIIVREKLSLNRDILKTKITQKQWSKMWNEDKPTILFSFLFKMNFITIKIYKKSVRWLLLLANPPIIIVSSNLQKRFPCCLKVTFEKNKIVPRNWKSILIEFKCDRKKSTTFLKTPIENVEKNIL